MGRSFLGVPHLCFYYFMSKETRCFSNESFLAESLSATRASELIKNVLLKAANGYVVLSDEKFVYTLTVNYGNEVLDEDDVRDKSSELIDLLGEDFEVEYEGKFTLRVVWSLSGHEAIERANPSRLTAALKPVREEFSKVLGSVIVSDPEEYNEGDPATLSLVYPYIIEKDAEHVRAIDSLSNYMGRKPEVSPDDDSVYLVWELSQEEFDVLDGYV